MAEPEADAGRVAALVCRERAEVSGGALGAVPGLDHRDSSGIDTCGTQQGAFEGSRHDAIAPLEWPGRHDLGVHDRRDHDRGR